ncbi:hypothetical protein [Pedobacter gandavensis]|uniref:Uncharacterized protein n=1 Tax=Pedobacter gandavensis TaxID=2679963 RepID=A0ABR6F1B2_9SPHI|nr:hypothetical protein [Pedobacter gandavensis]MBB2151297.1 hypothetical protein [Pedobacter gandavensis]
MISSSLEITESEYCIKLNKEDFDLTLIRQLITRIQSEQLFFSKKKEAMEDDIISRSNERSYEDFDRLSEK